MLFKDTEKPANCCCCICSVTSAECCKLPEDACRVTVRFPWAAFEGRFRVMFCDPAAIVNVEEGETVAPAGKPLTVTVTEPVNPFSAAIETCASNAPPGGTVAELGVIESAKSGGGGGGPDPPLDEFPPPQEVRASNRATKHVRRKRLVEIFRQTRITIRHSTSERGTNRGKTHAPIRSIKQTPRNRRLSQRDLPRKHHSLSREVQETRLYIKHARPFCPLWVPSLG